MPRLIGNALIVLLALLAAAGCNPQAESGGTSAPDGKPLKKVRLLLNWFPEAEHGGFYAAQVHGFFREKGLDVEIMPGGPNVPVVQQVAGGQVEFGVANADPVLFGRAEGAKVVAVMAPLQTSPRCIMLHKESGIRRFEELKNLTVAMSTTGAFAHYLQKKYPMQGVRVVPYSGSVAQFLQDKQFAQQGYVFSEPFVARKQGADPVVLKVADAGFNPYTSCLVISEETARDREDLVFAFVEASIRGWRKYLEAPDDTNRRIHELNPEMALDVLGFGAQELKPLVLTGEAKEKGIGWMTRERWETLIRQLVEIGQLEKGKANPDDVHTIRFLPGVPARKSDFNTMPMNQ